MRAGGQFYFFDRLPALGKTITMWFAMQMWVEVQGVKSYSVYVVVYNVCSDMFMGIQMKEMVDALCFTSLRRTAQRLVSPARQT